jgi:hypothetical protein
LKKSINSREEWRRGKELETEPQTWKAEVHTPLTHTHVLSHTVTHSSVNTVTYTPLQTLSLTHAHTQPEQLSLV